ncbi:hypothetical protein OIU78_004823, partial [Salix suchowensis]
MCPSECRDHLLLLWLFAHISSPCPSLTSLLPLLILSPLSTTTTNQCKKEETVDQQTKVSLNNTL